MTVRKRNKEILIPIAQQVARLLDGSWTVPLNRKHEDDYHNVLLHGPDSLVISLKIHQDRIVISGQYPKAADGTDIAYWSKADRASISVASTSAPKVIVGHIQRRLLPRYREALNQVREEIREHDEYEHQKRQNLDALARAAGTSLPDNGLGRFRWYLPQVRADVRVNSTTADLELRSLPVDLAVRIIETIRAFPTENEDKQE